MCACGYICSLTARILPPHFVRREKFENIECMEDLNTKIKRDEILKIRVSAFEKTAIQVKAQSTGLPMSTYIRRCALDKKIAVLPTSEEVQAYIELKNLEVNFKRISNLYAKNKNPYLKEYTQEIKNVIEEDQELYDFMKKKYGDDTDDNLEIEENLVRDPVISALINSENQIVVNDTIYEFTKKGLFFSSVGDREKLRNFIEKNDIYNYNNEIINQDFQSGTIKVDEGVYRFIAPLEERDIITPTATRLQKSRSLTPSLTSNIINDEYFKDLKPIIDNLPVTRGSNNWFLHTLFGSSKVSHDYFDRRHRVVTEYWNQNYAFYKSVGVSVRNQVRTFRIWWASKADEVALGINYAKITFDLPKPPDIQLPDYSKTFLEKPISYIYNDYVYSYTGSPLTSAMKVEKVGLPFFKVDNEKILNIYIPKVPIIGQFNYTLTTEDIISPSNIKSLYNEGFKLLKSLSSSQNKLAVVKEKNEYEVDVVFLYRGYRKTNTNKIKNHFDRVIGGALGYKANLGNPANGSWSVSPVELRDYRNVKMSFYGMARRGSTWKGARIEF